MVRIFEDKIDLEHVDFSFIPSLECNNKCWFCMYCAGPDNKLTLDLEKTKDFMETVE